MHRVKKKEIKSSFHCGFWLYFHLNWKRFVRSVVCCCCCCWWKVYTGYAPFYFECSILSFVKGRKSRIITVKPFIHCLCIKKRRNFDYRIIIGYSAWNDRMNENCGIKYFIVCSFVSLSLCVCACGCILSVWQQLTQHYEKQLRVTVQCTFAGIPTMEKGLRC